jgi:hypothetical protein
MRLRSHPMESGFMKTRYAVVLATLTGFGLGVVAVNNLRAQVKPPLYYVTEIDVMDPVGLQRNIFQWCSPL